MITLRPPQQGCSDAMINALISGQDGPLGVLGTGVGKSLVNASITKAAIDFRPGTRVLCLAHTKELIGQNHKAMLRYWPGAPCGINSAGLGTRDYNSQVIIGGIQSLYDKAEQLGHINICIIDEAQGVSRVAESMFGKLFSGLREINPNMKIAGLSATVFRTTCGWLHKGEGAMFSDIVYDYGIGPAIEDGYLVGPRTKSAHAQLDVSGVGKRGGEFIPSQLAEAVDVDEKTRAAVAETVAYARKHGLKKWVVFGTGTKHCENIRDELRAQGISSESLTGDGAKGGKRDGIIAGFEAGLITALVNIRIVAVGFDDPGIDFIVIMMATASASLFIQIVGRGARLIDPAIGNLPTKEQRLAAIASSSKPVFHVLDFGGNHRNGTIDDPVVRDNRSRGDGEAPVKICPKCDEILHASVRICPACGYEYPENDPNIDRVASTEVLLSSQREPVWKDVTNTEYSLHKSRKSGRDSMKVTYWCGIGQYYHEWITMAHADGRNWWCTREPGKPLPRDAKEMIDRAQAFKKPKRVNVFKEGKYWKVLGYDFGNDK